MEKEVVAIMEEAGVKFKTGTRSFIMTCPKCRKRDKLYIRRGDGRFVCFYCKEIDNFQGRPEYALAELTNLSFSEIRSRLYGEQVSEVPGVFIDLHLTDKDFLDDEIVLSTEVILPEVSFTADIISLNSEYSKPAVDYLLGRGVPFDIAQKYDLRYSPSTRRVIFPVYDQKRLLGWQGRYIGGESYVDEETQKLVTIPKALTSLGLKKDQALMFRNNLIGSDHCVLTEGPIDGIKADLCGGNVATMGKAVSRTQIDIIKNSGVRKVYIALDADATREVAKLVEQFRDLEIFDMRVKEGDLGAMTFEEVHKLFKACERFSNNKIFLYIKKDW